MSTIKTETLSTPSNATVPVDTVVNGTAKAWVNFNGSGTVAIRRAFNVASITDNGTGDYTVNFTTAMADANYTAVGSCNTNNAFSVQFVSMFVSAVSNSTVAPTTSGYRISTREAGGSGRDEEYVVTAIFS